MNGRSPTQPPAASGRKKIRGAPRSAMPPQGLSPKQYEAALLLSLGVRKTDVAATLGVTRKTIYNWLELPCFRAVVDRLTVDHAEEVKNRLGAKSLAVVEEALDARHIKPRNFSERLTAARIGMQLAGINGQGVTAEVAAAAVLVYGEPTDTAVANVERVSITEAELRAADQDLRRAEEAQLGEPDGISDDGARIATTPSAEGKEPPDG